MAGMGNGGDSAASEKMERQRYLAYFIYLKGIGHVNNISENMPELARKANFLSSSGRQRLKGKY